jgi:hypothetical protein
MHRNAWIFLLYEKLSDLISVYIYYPILIIQFLSHIFLQYSKICLILYHNKVFKIKTILFRYLLKTNCQTQIKESTHF